MDEAALEEIDEDEASNALFLIVCKELLGETAKEEPALGIIGDKKEALQGIGIELDEVGIELAVAAGEYLNDSEKQIIKDYWGAVPLVGRATPKLEAWLSKGDKIKQACEAVVAILKQDNTTTAAFLCGEQYAGIWREIGFSAEETVSEEGSNKWTVPFSNQAGNAWEGEGSAKISDLKLFDLTRAKIKECSQFVSGSGCKQTHANHLFFFKRLAF